MGGVVRVVELGFGNRSSSLIFANVIRSVRMVEVEI